MDDLRRIFTFAVTDARSTFCCRVASRVALIYRDMNGMEQRIDELADRVRVLEERLRQGASVGILYSRQQRQLEELAQQVEGITDILIQVLPILQKLDPSFDAHRLLESCNELKKKREPSDEIDEFFGSS
jgi:hypothetical protein